MKKKASPDDLLAPAQAAEVAGMSRIAFRSHVGKDIEPDARVGKDQNRALFRRSTVEAFVSARKKNGVRKRGPSGSR